MNTDTDTKEQIAAEMSANDKVFVDQIRLTLDKSLTEIDELTLVKLSYARKVALEQKRENKLPNKAVWVSLAAAASVFAVIIFPRQDYFSSISEQYTDELSYMSVDPQWLEDMEMLEAYEGEYDEV
jgi:hypothetical protein